ncbi:MAG TPA: hypothetical protein VKD19_04370 [Pseudolabrys sp.]|nr:hypothetical protein [Pseudolabrys sp.]
MAFQWRCAEAIRADGPASAAHEGGHADQITDLAIDHRRIVIAFVGMAPDGRASITAVLRGLIARPSQLPLLARIGIDAFAARGELLRVRRLLGPHFGLADFNRSASAPSEQSIHLQ